MEIYVIANGRVLSYILDPMFEKYLPIIPSEVSPIQIDDSYNTNFFIVGSTKSLIKASFRYWNRKITFNSTNRTS